MDGSAAREPDRKGLIVGVSECDDAACVLFQTLKCLVDHCTLHTTATYRSGDITVFVDRHRRAGKAWAGALDIDHAGQRNTFPLGPPALEIGEDFLHCFRLATPPPCEPAHRRSAGSLGTSHVSGSRSTAIYVGGVTTASTSADLREVNLARALTLVHEASRELTRVELADRLGVTRTTAAALVNDLVALDLILERDADPTGRRGRPTTNIRPNPRGPVVLAAEVGLDAISISEVAIGGKLSNHTVVRLDSIDPDDALEQLDRLLHLRRSEQNSVCAGIGVAMHGLVDNDSGTVVQAPNLGWEGVPLGDHLSRSHGLPVSVGNDATLGAIVEAKRGAGRMSNTMLYLRSTVGVGGAFVFDAKPAPSRRGWHGEMGHLPFGDERNKCRCGAYGCWENAINQSALAHAAGLTPSIATADQLARSVLLAAGEGEDKAGAAVAEICTILGRGLGALINALDPDIIVLSGHVRSLYETDPQSTLMALRAATMRAHRDSLPPVRSGIVEFPALAGAAEVMLTRLIESPSRFLAPG